MLADIRISKKKVSRKTKRLINVTKLVTIVTKMISLIKQGYWKILQLFYKDKSARIHLRAIARSAKLYEPSATKFLKSLEKDDILRSEMDGNQKKYHLLMNNNTFSIFTLFDLERLNSLPSIRKNAINYYLDNLEEKPLIAFLFGSSAKGTFKDNSDIDLLIITNTKIKTQDAQKHSEALTGLRISTFQLTIEAFKREIKLKEDPVIQSAISSGYPILNQMYYYEVLYNGHQIS